MQPLSNDLRQRILDAVDNKEGSRRKLAARFKVNTSTITKLLRLRRETGSYQPRPHGGGGAPTLDGDAPERLRPPARSPPPPIATPWNGSVASSSSPPTPRSRRSGRRWASPAAG